MAIREAVPGVILIFCAGWTAMVHADQSSDTEIVHNGESSETAFKLRSAVATRQLVAIAPPAPVLAPRAVI